MSFFIAKKAGDRAGIPREQKNLKKTAPWERRRLIAK
jgi:hypothetical protein